MKAAIASLLNLHNRQQIALDVEDELQFHLQMLERKYLQQGMGADEARRAALRQFGNIERYKRQCVQISRRKSVLRRSLKVLLFLLGLAGLLIRILNMDYKISRVGVMLIAIAVSGRLLLYVRGLTPRNPECS
jgi:hypothetical protein